MPAVMIKELTPKIIRAVEGYIHGKSMRQAMIDAGYSPKYCEGNVAVMRFLKNRLVIEYIRKRQAEQAEASNKDAAYIIKKLEHIIASDSDKDRVKACELLTRLVVPLVEPNKITASDIKSISINIETATNEQPKANNT